MKKVLYVIVLLIIAFSILTITVTACSGHEASNDRLMTEEIITIEKSIKLIQESVIKSDFPKIELEINNIQQNWINLKQELQIRNEINVSTNFEKSVGSVIGALKSKDKSLLILEIGKLSQDFTAIKESLEKIDLDFSILIPRLIIFISFWLILTIAIARLMKSGKIRQ